MTNVTLSLAKNLSNHSGAIINNFLSFSVSKIERCTRSLSSYSKGNKLSPKRRFLSNELNKTGIFPGSYVDMTPANLKAFYKPVPVWQRALVYGAAVGGASFLYSLFKEQKIMKKHN